MIFKIIQMLATVLFVVSIDPLEYFSYEFPEE
jgi:hypothetical protein